MFGRTRLIAHPFRASFRLAMHAKSSSVESPSRSGVSCFSPSHVPQSDMDEFFPDIRGLLVDGWGAVDFDLWHIVVIGHAFEEAFPSFFNYGIWGEVMRR